MSGRRNAAVNPIMSGRRNLVVNPMIGRRNVIVVVITRRFINVSADHLPLLQIA
jgi:hypothetical protein